MKLTEVGSVFKHKWVQVLGALVLTVVVVAGFIGAMNQQSSKPPTPPTLRDLPVITLPIPPAVMSKDELDKASERARARKVPIVAAGITVELPADAKMDGLVVRADFPTEIPEGITVKQLPLPMYIIIRGGEMASVSWRTGEFQIGEGHEKEFQFLIDQLGRDKMQLIDKDFYEKRWGPFRENYKEEGE